MPTTPAIETRPFFFPIFVSLACVPVTIHRSSRSDACTFERSFERSGKKGLKDSTCSHKVHHESRPFPERERLLVNPREGFNGEFDVKIPKNLGENESHLGVGKTVSTVSLGPSNDNTKRRTAWHKVQ